MVTKGFLYTDAMVAGLGKSVVIERITQFVKTLQTGYFNLGGLLLRVRDEGLFVDWVGVEYLTFEEWCEEVLKFRSRKAQHLITIYKGVRELDPPKPLMRRMLTLGWNKVAQILRVAHTLGQLKKWIKRAEGISLRELTAKVQFELAQLEGGTEDEVAISVAEEMITFKARLTESQHESLTKALDVLSKRFPSETDGARLNMMVLAYMSQHVRDDEGGLAIELSHLLAGIESAFGIRLKITKGGGKKARPMQKKKKAKKAG